MGSSFDTLIGAYSGTAFGDFAQVASNDDAAGQFLTSEITFNAVFGTAYHIFVDGFGGAKGSIILSWSLEVTDLDLLPEEAAHVALAEAEASGRQAADRDGRGL